MISMHNASHKQGLIARTAWAVSFVVALIGMFASLHISKLVPHNAAQAASAEGFRRQNLTRPLPDRARRLGDAHGERVGERGPVGAT